MSSTTEPNGLPNARMRGQALAFFSLTLSALLIVMALALDVGIMIVERRDQQNAADAAAIAAARYVVTAPSQARTTAVSLASANGFTDGAGAAEVAVNIPPLNGDFAGRPYYIEVEIKSTRPSLLGALIDVLDWQVASRAVATNQDTVHGEWAFIALDPAVCDAGVVSGNGSVVAYGNIQVNSNCTAGALRRQGAGNIAVSIPGGACNVVGDIQDGGGQGIFDCIQNEGAPSVPDPLAALSPPAVPDLPDAMQQLVGSLQTPTGCPGSADPASATEPLSCQFQSSYAGTTWRIFPGLYPGGLKLQGGTFYMEPGIYYIGGGGFDASGTGTTLRSVAPGGTTGPAGGVMFYNSALPGSAIGSVTLNGSAADIALYPLKDGSRYENLLFWQDRAYDIGGDDLTINGSSATMEVRGLIYVPSGDIKVNGGAGTLYMDTTIGNRFSVAGSNGSLIQILDEDQYRFALLAAGLVE